MDLERRCRQQYLLTIHGKLVVSGVACIVDGLDLLRSDGPCFNRQQTPSQAILQERNAAFAHMISRRLFVFHRTWPGSFCGSAYDCRRWFVRVRVVVRSCSWTYGRTFGPSPSLSCRLPFPCIMLVMIHGWILFFPVILEILILTWLRIQT
jgi:hypothetical protein